MATPEDRSLSAGIFIPRWMKTKIHDTFDLDSTAYSPTELDDSFMIYYRNTRGSNELKTVNNTKTTTTNLLTEENKSITPSCNKNIPNFAKHTLPCQKFLENGNKSAVPQQVKYPSNTTKVKSSGIDDGFKGEAAKCGSSVIRVAQRLVAGKMIHGFNIEKHDCPQDTMQQQQQQQQNIKEYDQSTADLPPAGFNPSIRRGSKSLPASPLASPNTSPKSKRRINKYFTGPFTDTDKHHGWILSNLLSHRKTLSHSASIITEEESHEIKKAASNISVDDVTTTDQNKNKKNMFVPKASELREMNFLSPTSM